MGYNADMALPDTGVLLVTRGGGTSAADLEALLATARAAEADGAELLVLDTRPGGTAATGPGRLLDPFAVLGACAAETTTLRLGALVAADERPPGVLAKALATLDVCSDGRAALLLAPPVAPVDGAAPEAVLAECVQVVVAMLAEPAATVAGKHVSVREAWNEPRSALPPPVGIALDLPPAAALAVAEGFTVAPACVVAGVPEGATAGRPGQPGAPGATGRTVPLLRLVPV